MKLKQSDSIYPFPPFFVTHGLSPYQCVVAKYSGECLAKLIRFQSRIRSSSIIYDFIILKIIQFLMILNIQYWDLLIIFSYWMFFIITFWMKIICMMQLTSDIGLKFVGVSIHKFVKFFIKFFYMHIKLQR